MGETMGLRDSGQDGGQGGGAARPGRLQQLLVEVASLTWSEARTVEALLRLGTATLKQLLEATDVSRSNMYPVLDSLSAKGLCQRLPGQYAVWECPDRQEVLARLRAAEEGRLRAALEAAGRGFDEVATMLADLPSTTEGPSSPTTVVNEARLGVMYVEAMASVESEVLVLNHGPYPGELEADSPVLDALARGVRARAIYQQNELAAADGALRSVADAYARAGVEQRVAERVPATVAVLDHDFVLLSLPNPEGSPEPFHSLGVRHERMGELVSAAFEHLWQQARPYEITDEPESTRPDTQSVT